MLCTFDVHHQKRACNAPGGSNPQSKDIKSTSVISCFASLLKAALYKAMNCAHVVMFYTCSAMGVAPRERISSQLV